MANGLSYVSALRDHALHLLMHFNGSLVGYTELISSEGVVTDRPSQNSLKMPSSSINILDFLHKHSSALMFSLSSCPSRFVPFMCVERLAGAQVRQSSLAL